MADRNKFEQMLELLVNEDKEAAEKLFHDIVVEKSRDIYEGLLEDDKDVDEATDSEVEEASDEEVDETTDEKVEEKSDEDVDEATDEKVEEKSDEEVDENFNLDEFEVEAEPEMGGDAADDMMTDLGMDDEGGDEEGEEPEGDVEDRVEDLEDALEDLKAEFEKMMADGGDEEPGDEEPEEESILPFEASDEEVEEASDEEVEEASDEEVEEASDEEVEETKKAKSAGEEMREYVEKVSGGGLDAQKIGGDNGANTKSTVASPNNMGGTASNLVQGSEESGGEHAGLGDMNAKDQDGGNVNVPGGKASKSLKAQPGHGAEKKGKPEAAADKKSMIGS